MPIFKLAKKLQEEKEESDASEEEEEADALEDEEEEVDASKEAADT